jgi:hypothetical protein
MNGKPALSILVAGGEGRLKKNSRQMGCSLNDILSRNLSMNHSA